jgi:hypothetical protein
MSLRPRLSALDLWQRHEDFVLGVFREALRLLRDDPPDGSDEPTLNRALYLKVLRVNYNRLRAGEGTPNLSAPTWEGQNPPSPTTEGTGAESKRPDFYWGYQDSSDPDPDSSVRNLVIECKRLGSPSSSKWDFNRKYVHNGIVRFVDPGHSYGKDATSGAMIGYLQSMSVDEVLDIVNKEVCDLDLPRLDPRHPHSDGLTEHGHVLNRTFRFVDFALHHVWADMHVEEEVEMGEETSIVLEHPASDADH